MKLRILISFLFLFALLDCYHGDPGYGLCNAGDPSCTNEPAKQQPRIVRGSGLYATYPIDVSNATNILATAHGGTGGTSGAGGWTDALNPAAVPPGFDFSAQPNQTIAVDGPVTIGGFTWNKFGSAQEAHTSALAIVNGAGLRIFPGRNAGFSVSSDYNFINSTAARTSPGLDIALSQLTMPNASWTMALRISIEVATETQANVGNFDGTAIGIDDGGTTNDNGAPYFSGTAAFCVSSGGNRVWGANRRSGNTSTALTQTTGTAFGSAPVKTIQLYVNALASGAEWITVFYTPSTAAWPTEAAWQPTITSSVDNHLLFQPNSGVVPSWQIPANVTSMHVAIAGIASSEFDGYVVTVKRLRVQYHL